MEFWQAHEIYQEIPGPTQKTCKRFIFSVQCQNPVAFISYFFYDS